MHGGCYVWLTCLNCTILSASTISADLMNIIPSRSVIRRQSAATGKMDLFNTVKEKLGDVDVIAEDLGYLTESVIEMVKESGYPGMKVLQFAFDSREESDYLPHNYERNCVVYTGTHDNDTILGWYYVMSEEDREFSKEYMGNAKSTDEELPWDFIRMSMESVANLAVTPMQEFLGLGTEARINYPSTLGNNWKWRLLPGQFTSEMAKRIHRLTQITARIAK